MKDCLTFCRNFILAALLLTAVEAPAAQRPDAKAKRAVATRLARFEARQSSGNDIAFYPSNTGFLAVNPTSPFAPGGFWPSGSTNNYVYQSGLNVLGIIDADGDGVFGDTVEVSAVYDAEWREGRASGSSDSPEAALFFSSSADDLALWPEEFRKTDDDPDSPAYGRSIPSVTGDQDIVALYTDIGGPVFQSAGSHRLGVQVAQRIVLISTGLERDMLFVNWKLANASAWADLTEVAQAPYDIRGALVDIKTDFDIGVATDDASAVLPSRQTALAYDSDFSESAFGRQPAIQATALLYSPTEDDGLDNPTALEPHGNGLVDETFGEIMAAGLTHPRTGEPLTFPEEVRNLKAERFFLYTMYTFGDLRPDPYSDAEAYRILSAAPGTSLLPAFDPYASFLESTVVEDLRQNVVAGPFDLSAQGEAAEVWAALVFATATDDPARNGRRADLSKLTPEGEFSHALAVTDAARRTFEAGFLRPLPPASPEMRLVPGDRQVTVTWSELPVSGTYDSYADTWQAGQLTLRDSIPDGFQRITGYRANDFQGFRVYRSLTGERADAVQIAQFDLADGIVDYNVTRTVTADGFTGTGPYNLKLGSDTGLQFSFVDRGEDIGGLVNGVPLFYTVTSYDYNPYNWQGESLESNIGFKRQDSRGNFVQQAAPRGEASSWRGGAWDSELTGGDGIPYSDETLPPIVSDTLGSSSDTVTVDPLDPTNRSILRHNLVVDFPQSPLPQSAALAAGEINLVWPLALPDSGVFVIDSVESAQPATRYFNMYYHWRDSEGRVTSGSVLDKSFPYSRSEKVATFRYDGRTDSLGVIYSGSVEIFRGGRADAKVAPLRVNGVTGSLLSPGINYPHPQYRFTTQPARVTFPGAPFVVLQPMNLDQLNSEYVSGEAAAATSNMAAFAPGDIEICWESESRVASVRDLTHRVDIRFSQFTDDGWGFLPLDTHSHSDMIWQSLNVQPKHKRTFRLLPSPPYYSHPENPDSVSMALYVRGVELFVTGISQKPRAGDVWLVRCGFNNASGGQVSPAPGQRVSVHFTRGARRPEDERLSRVRAVPNPYLVSSALDSGPSDKNIMFTGLPESCTIRIYTLSGVLVNVLEHGPGVPESRFSSSDSGGGSRLFDLRNRFGQLMASGTYYFHVESKGTGKEQIGKFSIIN